MLKTVLPVSGFPSFLKLATQVLKKVPVTILEAENTP
jgi:hypothetical protein